MAEDNRNNELLPPTEQFALNATLGANQWWRWVIGLISILVIWIGVGAFGLAYAGCFFLRATNVFGLDCSDSFEFTGDGHVLALLVFGGLGFAIALLGIWWVVKLVHKKDLKPVVTGRPRFDLSRYLVATLVGLVLSLALFLFNRYVLQWEMNFQAPGWEFVIFLPIALVLVPIQSGFEEVLFRGYILQGLMLLLKNKIVLAVLVGVIFALPHLANPEPGEFGVVPFLVVLASSGIFYTVLVLLDGGIELAAGYHMMNNLFLGVVSNTEDAVIQTPSLFVVQVENYNLFPNVAVEILAFVLAVAILNFKYKWFKLGAR